MTKQYDAVLAALERKADLVEIEPLLEDLRKSSVGIDEADPFGLTISMRAAAHGRLDVVQAAGDRDASLWKPNSETGANLLHYAAQQPEGGAAILKWAIVDEGVSVHRLNERLLILGKDRKTDKAWNRGNGHTVAFEAVFNKNVEVVKALLDIDRGKNKVDFTTPAVHGVRPLGWALNTRAEELVRLLVPMIYNNSAPSDDILERNEKEFADKYFDTEDRNWRLSSHDPLENDALNLADELRQYILEGHSQYVSVGDLLDRAFEKGVKPNAPYGQFGQPLLILIPSHPQIINITPTKEQQDRYTYVARMLIDRGAKPRTREKGLMEVSAGFREVFFGYMDALELMIERVERSERKEFVAEQGLFNGYTRLIDAALIGQTAAIGLLLAYDTEPSIKSKRGFNGWTARDAASRSNIATAVQNLLFEALVGFRR